MILKGILYLTALTFSMCLMSYPGVADSNGWAKGTKSGTMSTVGAFLTLFIVFESFFEFKWWVVLIGIVLSYFLGATLTDKMKKYTQLISPVVVVITGIAIFIYKLLTNNT